MNVIFDNILKTFEDQDTASKAIQKVLIQTCAERNYSSQEVLHLATGNKLFLSSRVSGKINFNTFMWVAIGPKLDLDVSCDIEVNLKYVKNKKIRNILTNCHNI